jgi:Uma2 family endonuclease
MVELSLGLRTVDLPFTVQVPDVTEEMFDELVDEDTKAELIDGVMIVHSPASTRHDDVCYVRKKGVGSLLGPDSLVRLRPRRKFAPDFYFLEKDRARRMLKPTHCEGVPDLVGEILSPSNRRHDLEVKRPAYQEAGASEIWLIDPDKEKLLVDRRRGKRYTTNTYNRGRVESRVIPGFWIDASWLWQDELPDALDCLREILGEDAV